MLKIETTTSLNFFNLPCTMDEGMTDKQTILNSTGATLFRQGSRRHPMDKCSAYGIFGMYPNPSAFLWCLPYWYWFMILTMASWFQSNELATNSHTSNIYFSTLYSTKSSSHQKLCEVDTRWYMQGYIEITYFHMKPRYHYCKQIYIKAILLP